MSTASGQAIFRDTPAPPRRPSFFKRVWNHRHDYWYVLPAIIVMLIVIAYPIYYTIELSFFNTPASLSLANKKFNGLDNYVAILTSPIFWKVSWQTLVWTVLSTIFAFLLGLGAALVHSFSWILLLFGALLIFTGIKMFRKHDAAPDIENNAVFRFLRRHVPITRTLENRHFLVRMRAANSGRLVWALTPLGLALIMVETVDLIFAVDSVPAVFAVTQDTFIVYTSNIFAILGLRALYFALAAAMNRFAYLQISLAIVLLLIGTKVALVPVGIKIDTMLSLIVTVGILAGGILYSLWKTRDKTVNG